jgi:hypothetical protein
MKRDQADPKILDYKATSHTLFIVQSTCLITKSTVPLNKLWCTLHLIKCDKIEINEKKCISQNSC